MHQVASGDLVMMGDSDMLITSSSILAPLAQVDKWEVWVYWWEAVVRLNQSLPLSLLTMRADKWRRTMRGATTVQEVTSLPGAIRRVFTRQDSPTSGNNDGKLISGKGRHLQHGRWTRARQQRLSSRLVSAHRLTILLFGDDLVWSHKIKLHQTLAGEVNTATHSPLSPLFCPGQGFGECRASLGNVDQPQLLCPWWHGTLPASFLASILPTSSPIFTMADQFGLLHPPSKISRKRKKLSRILSKSE